MWWYGTGRIRPSVRSWFLPMMLQRSTGLWIKWTWISCNQKAAKLCRKWQRHGSLQRKNQKCLLRQSSCRKGKYSLRLTKRDWILDLKTRARTQKILPRCRRRKKRIRPDLPCTTAVFLPGRKALIRRAGWNRQFLSKSMQGMDRSLPSGRNWKESNRKNGKRKNYPQ